MNDTAPIGHNNPPAPILADLVNPAVIDTIITAELDREPEAPEGGTIPSIRARDLALVDMCKRFLAKYPKIEDDETETRATSVLSTATKFPGRVESARKALKQPVWDAGVAIDAAFGKYGAQMEIRPATGPANKRRQAPFTLAEQINMRLAEYKDEKDRKIREEAAELARAKAEEARIAEESAARGGVGTMQQAADAAQAAESADAVVNAPAAALTRSSGGDYGGSASLKRVRTFTVIQGQEHLIPRELCIPSDALIRAAVGKHGEPMPTIPGIEITEVLGNNVR